MVPSSGLAVATVSDLSGAALVHVPMPSLGSGAASADVPAVGPAPRFGPFGEPLVVPSSTSSVPQYQWQAGQGLETLAGSSGIVLMGARPMSPALGQFLAVDPDPGSGNNLYSYTSGDPINRTDRSGNAESLGVIGQWIGIGGLVLSALGPLGLAIGAFAALASTGLQAASAAMSPNTTTADWVSLGLTAAFTVFGGVTAVRSLKTSAWIIRTKQATLQSRLSEGGTAPSVRGVATRCLLTWSCSVAGIKVIGKTALPGGAPSSSMTMARGKISANTPQAAVAATRRNQRLWWFGFGG